MAISGYNEENFKKFDKFFKEKGLNEYARAGLAGNLYVESKFNFNILQNKGRNELHWTSEQYTANVDNGSYGNFENDRYGYGLCQWTSAGRKSGYLNLAKSKNLSIGSSEVGLEWLWTELSTAYKKSVLIPLQNGKSVDECSRIVMCKFERPADQSEENQRKRSSISIEFYNKYYNKKDPSDPIQGFDKYVFQKDDTIYSLAKKYNTTVDYMMDINRGIISDARFIKEGTKINVPKTKTSNTSEIKIDNTIIESAKFKDEKIAGTYTCINPVNLRKAANTNDPAIIVIPKNSIIKCYGYFNKTAMKKWYKVQVTIGNVKYTGYVDSSNINKI